MFDSKEFQLWLRLTLGQEAARDAEESRYQVPAAEVKIEVRHGGRWTQVDEASLRD
jgi:hypothetical protein